MSDKKCKAVREDGKHKIVNTCDTLDAAMEPLANAMKNISMLQYTNIETRKPTSSFVVCYTGDFKPPRRKDGGGMIVNFCPFCGEKLFIEDESKPEVGNEDNG